METEGFSSCETVHLEMLKKIMYCVATVSENSYIKLKEKNEY